MPHILIVEDDTDINNSTAEYLRRKGCRCSQAFSGTEGRLLWQAGGIDLLLVDLMLPGLSGSELETKFDELMNEKSEDGGLITAPRGYYFLPGEMVQPFEESVLSLGDGEMSPELVESDFGYHIILRLPMNPDDFRDECISSLLEEKIEKAELDLAKMDALVKLDVGSFWDQMLSLQSAVQAELAG